MQPMPHALGQRLVGAGQGDVHRLHLTLQRVGQRLPGQALLIAQPDQPLGVGGQSGDALLSAPRAVALHLILLVPLPMVVQQIEEGFVQQLAQLAAAAQGASDSYRATFRTQASK